MWSFHFRVFWCRTPRSLNDFVLSISSPSIERGGGSGMQSRKQIHMSLVFFEFRVILLWSAHICMQLRTSCMLLTSPSLTDSSRVQSSAYLCVFTASELGIESSTSFTYTLKSVGEMTEHCGTPAGHGDTVDKKEFSFTCWLRPSKKLWIHSQRFLLILSSASFLMSIPWSTMSKAFLKSKKRAWTPMRPSGELSVALNHIWEIQARADTVDRFCIKACWLFLISRSCLCKDNWSFSNTFASCEKNRYLTKIVVYIIWGVYFWNWAD